MIKAVKWAKIHNYVIFEGGGPPPLMFIIMFFFVGGGTLPLPIYQKINIQRLICKPRNDEDDEVLLSAAAAAAPRVARILTT